MNNKLINSILAIAAAPPDNNAPEKRRNMNATEYSDTVKGMAFERKGVLFSEMFFLLCAMASLNGKGKLVESGRARGQSTEILGRCLRNSKIVSIEFDKNSPDAPVAELRLKNLKNVELLYGDSCLLMPQHMEAGDFAFIDGPKGFRGIRLAIKLLAKNKPSAVFIHDCGKGSAEREFLEKNFPNSVYSDHPDFVEMYWELDKECADGQPPINIQNYRSEFQQGAGYSTLACIPGHNFNYPTKMLKALVAGFGLRIKNSITKRFRKHA